MTYFGPLARRIGAAWSWWIGELTALLPEGTRMVLEERSWRVFVQLTGDELVLSYGSADRAVEIGRYSRTGDERPDQQTIDSRPLVLLLPAGQFLKKTITLPAATEDNLRDVLALDMDQQTPFIADQVFFDYAVVNRSRADRTIDVEMLATPRERLQELLDAIGAFGLAPDVVTARRDSDGIYDVNLIPSGLRRRRRPVTRRANVALIGACGLLLIAIAIVPIYQKRHLISLLEPRVIEAREAAKVGLGLREEITRITDAYERLLSMKESAPMALQVINEMTRIIPDGTWISQLDMRGNEVQIQGQSPAAASLIGLIQQSAYFDNPQFRSPVTRAPQSGMERFHLSAEWTGDLSQ